MRKNLYILGAFLLCACPSAMAGERSAADSMQAKATAVLARSCLKGMLMQQDFQVLKKNKLAELDRLDEAAFREDYARSWDVLRKCPRLVAKYRLRADLSKKEAAAIIGRLTRGECLEAVDQVPDEVLADLLGRGLPGTGQQEQNLSGKIAAFMQGGAAPEAGKK